MLGQRLDNVALELLTVRSDRKSLQTIEKSSIDRKNNFIVFFLRFAFVWVAKVIVTWEILPSATSGQKALECICLLRKTLSWRNSRKLKIVVVLFFCCPYRWVSHSWRHIAVSLEFVVTVNRY